MAIEVKAGTRLGSAVCDVEVIVIKAPAEAVDLRCGGQPMVAVGTAQDTLSAAPGFDTATLLGKRYIDESASVELLCTKGGSSSLSIGDTLLLLKDAKPLPSSD